MSIQLKDYHQRFQLIKKQQAEILVQQLEQLRKFMIICVYLFARVGHPICPIHDIEITSQTIEQMVDRILEYPERTKIQILAPIISGRKGSTCQSS